MSGQVWVPHSTTCCVVPALVRLVRVTSSSVAGVELVLRGAHRRQSIRYNVRMQPQSAVAILLLLQVAFR